MVKILSKLSFYLQKPDVILVIGKRKSIIAEAIRQILTTRFKTKIISNSKLPFIRKDEILIWATDATNRDDINFLARYSKKFTLVIDAISTSDNIQELIRNLPSKINLILNADDKLFPEIKDLEKVNIFTFSLQEKSDFQATDIIFNGKTNFKINHKGNIVPVWLDKICDQEQIYAALAAASVGVIFDLNLVEISQSFPK